MKKKSKPQKYSIRSIEGIHGVKGFKIYDQKEIEFLLSSADKRGKFTAQSIEGKINRVEYSSSQRSFLVIPYTQFVELGRPRIIRQNLETVDYHKTS